MPANDLGCKYTCYKCEAKFYDLKRPEPICPKCHANQRDPAAQKAPEPRRNRLAVAPKPASRPEVTSEDEATEDAEPSSGEEEESETNDEEED